MKLVILAGVDEAGKSTTIRHSVKYLGVSRDLQTKFLNQIHPPNNMRVNDTPLYVYITSPQEVTGGKIQQSVEVFRRRIIGREQNAMVITAFNLENKYEQSIEACLNELNVIGLRDSTFFVFLNADLNDMAEPNDQAKMKVGQLVRRGYNFIGEIHRTSNTQKNEQGWKFAYYINQKLKV